MKNVLYLTVAVLAGALAQAWAAPAAPAASATPAAPSLLPARVMQAAHDRVAAGEYPMLVIGMVDGKESRLYAFNAAGDKVADENTEFEIGSVTKTFTALLLAEAVKSGAVTLDEPVAKLLPDFAIPSRDGKFITLGNLADQHSGLPRLPGNLKPANPADPYSRLRCGRPQGVPRQLYAAARAGQCLRIFESRFRSARLRARRAGAYDLRRAGGAKYFPAFEHAHERREYEQGDARASGRRA